MNIEIILIVQLHLVNLKLFLNVVKSMVKLMIHFINECVVYIPWTTPPLLSGYLATAGDWRAVIVQAVILVLGVLLYIPFVKMNDIVMEKTMASE